MNLSNVLRLTTYTTNIDAMFEHYARIAGRVGANGSQPPGLSESPGLRSPNSLSSSKPPQ